MSDRMPIFRSEALELHARGRDVAGGVVRLGRPWLTWLFWSTLVLFAAGVIGLWATRIEQTATGPALVERGSGSVTVLLPAAVASNLTGSEQLRVEFPGSPAGSVPVVVVGAQMADEELARRAGFGSESRAGVVVAGRLTDGSVLGRSASDRLVHTRGVLVLRSERLVDVLGHQVQMMLGSGTAHR